MALMVTHMALGHSSPSDPFSHSENSHSRPSTLRASPDMTTPSNHPKKCLAKARWSTTEEAMLATVLSDQKCVSNTSENGFKGTVWKMVEAGVRAIGEGPSKTSKQCKARYQWVSHHLPFLSFC